MSEHFTDPPRPTNEEGPPGAIQTTPGRSPDPAGLYDGFSGQARKAVQVAHREARRLGLEYLGTEHLLLGVLREGSEGVARLLAACGTDGETVYRQVEPQLPRDTGERSGERLLLTPAGRRVLQYARDEAARLRHPCVGPEHLLAGLLREPEGTAAQALLPLGITADRLEPELARLPAPDNRDWLIQPEPIPGLPSRTDPSARDLVEAIVTEEMLPPGPPLVSRPWPPRTQIPGMPESETRVLESQLQALQVVVPALVGALLGATKRDFIDMVLGAICGMFVGCLFMALRSNLFARITGLTAGAIGGGLYGGQHIAAVILGALVGLLLGICLGDWRKLMTATAKSTRTTTRKTDESFTELK